MNLHGFIQTHHETILAEWVKFADTCTPASYTMDLKALRDHGEELLTGIAARLQPPPDEPKAEHTADDAAAANDAELTAAKEHGSDRAGSGFTIEQTVAEYRALRTSVLQLWARDRREATSADLADLNRFHEAIDQALAESVSEFSENMSNAKELFLAILGHDLRNPLGAIYTTAQYMGVSDDLAEPHRSFALEIEKCALRATRMVGDLLDFTRSRLGDGIPVNPTPMNLDQVLRCVISECEAAHPERTIDLQPGGACVGCWDPARIHQALTNLIVNAFEHGAPDRAVRVSTAVEEEKAAIRIHNHGTAIPADRLDGIFNPMKVQDTSYPTAQGPTGHLGLGLYITERIVHAHGGRIQVDSSDEQGTTFCVLLPDVTDTDTGCGESP